MIKKNHFYLNLYKYINININIFIIKKKFIKTFYLLLLAKT